MARVTMYREPLELYLLQKIRAQLPLSVQEIRIQTLSNPRFGCNWDVVSIEPSLPVDMLRLIDRDVVAPAKVVIDLVE